MRQQGGGKGLVVSLVTRYLLCVMLARMDTLDAICKSSSAFSSVSEYCRERGTHRIGVRRYSQVTEDVGGPMIDLKT